MNNLLHELTDVFAEDLNCALARVVNSSTRFVVESLWESRLAVQLKYPNNKVKGLPLVRSCDDPNIPSLFLRARYIVEMDNEDTYLQVVASTIGLWIDSTGGQREPRPLVRVEYDRRKRKYSPSHVHLHAHSCELEWLYGSSGQDIPNLHSLHFPAGGRRFRPTFENFLLFLDQEKIFTDWKEGYKTVLEEAHLKWERLQVKAATRRYPQEAVEALERLGYRIMPPNQTCVGG